MKKITSEQCYQVANLYFQGPDEPVIMSSPCYCAAGVIGTQMISNASVPRDEIDIQKLGISESATKGWLETVTVCDVGMAKINTILGTKFDIQVSSEFSSLRGVVKMRNSGIGSRHSDIWDIAQSPFGGSKRFYNDGMIDFRAMKSAHDFGRFWKAHGDRLAEQEGKAPKADAADQFMGRLRNILDEQPEKVEAHD